MIAFKKIILASSPRVLTIALQVSRASLYSSLWFSTATFLLPFQLAINNTTAPITF
jgi:hypothetical protein